MKIIIGLIITLLLALGLGTYFAYSNHTKVPAEGDLVSPVVATAPPAEVAATIKTYEKTRIGLPQRLIIPRIGVNAVVEHLGLTPLGAMDSPNGPDNAAWYNLGPRPGEEGSAVIAGHRGWKNSIPAAFDRLGDLKVGDKIEIIDEKGGHTFFVVTGSKVFDAKADATSVFSSVSGKHLNLITCIGVWDTVSKSSSQRLVVFAEKID